MKQRGATNVAVKRLAALLLGVLASWGALAGADAVAVRTVIEVSAGGGDAAPVIALAPGRVATVSFSDVAGEPWPVTQVMGPEADWLFLQRAQEHSHVVFLESRRKGGSGNMVALLDGLAAPVHLGIVSKSTAGLAYAGIFRCVTGTPKVLLTY